MAGKPGYARRKDLPTGYHVTLYPNNLTPEQSMAAIANLPLQQVPNRGAIEFDAFNVTRDSDDRHFYFDESGHVVWARTQREANIEDPGWDDAVKAALVIYGLIGVDASEAALYSQLHVMGRKLPVSARDAAAKPKPVVPKPTQGGGKPFMPKPRSVAINKGRNPPTQPPQVQGPPPQAPPPQIQAPSPPVHMLPPVLNYQAVPWNYGPSPMDVTPQNPPDAFIPLFEHEEEGELTGMDWQ